LRFDVYFLIKLLAWKEDFQRYQNGNSIKIPSPLGEEV